MTRTRKWVLIAICFPALIIFLILARPLTHLAWAWRADPAAALKKPAPGIDEASESAMQDFARELIDAALACGGTYNLPYRPHATRLQFEVAYPQGVKFFEAKRRYDPGEIFQNKFYLQYGNLPRD